MPNDSERLDALEAAESGPNNSDDQYEAWRDNRRPYVGYDEWLYQQEAILDSTEEHKCIQVLLAHFWSNLAHFWSYKALCKY